MLNNYSLATSSWDDKEIDAIKSVIKKDIYTMGNSVVKFENDF